MATRTITSLPQQLVNIVFQMGNRKLVLLEGDDDVEVLEEWFKEDLSEILFYAAEGNVNVETYLNSMLSHSIKRQVYGIIDRDFRTDQEVTACNDNVNIHLFILHRYAIENYLLEPSAVWEELKTYHGRYFTETTETISLGLIDLCRKLKTIMAANWVIKESNTGAEYFKKGYEIDDRDEIIRQTSRRLQYHIIAAEQKISVKEQLIESKLDTLENAHTFINGKHLFHQLYDKYVNAIKRGLRRDHLRNLLTRNIKEKVGIHGSLTEIIKRRIL